MFAIVPSENSDNDEELFQFSVLKEDEAFVMQLLAAGNQAATSLIPNEENDNQMKSRLDEYWKFDKKGRNVRELQ